MYWEEEPVVVKREKSRMEAGMEVGRQLESVVATNLRSQSSGADSMPIANH
jgi:hypothetical protein